MPMSETPMERLIRITEGRPYRSGCSLTDRMRDACMNDDGSFDTDKYLQAEIDNATRTVREPSK
jgi:hypothetical protein